METVKPTGIIHSLIFQQQLTCHMLRVCTCTNTTLYVGILKLSTMQSNGGTPILCKYVYMYCHS